MSILDPKDYVKRLIELHGGHDAFFELMDQRLKEFNAVWDQEADKIGRVLRAHLAVEHFLTEYLTFTNPHLGSVEDARLSFSQKVELLPGDDSGMSFLKPGLRRLNTIRNRMAHRLRVDLCAEDRDTLLSIALFSAMRDEGARRDGPKPDDPLAVVEQFAMFAANLLQAGSNPKADLWRQAAQREESP